MSAIAITSIFKTLRPCLRCGTPFYPPKRPDRLIMDYCSAPCERKVGLGVMKRTGDITKRRRAPKNGGHRPQPPRARRVYVRSGFATRLNHYRLVAGLTHAALAQRIGVSKRAIETWTCDLADPGPQHLAALADVFGVSMDDLWRGTAPVPVAAREATS